jgi:hypothetical protein
MGLYLFLGGGLHFRNQHKYICVCIYKYVCLYIYVNIHIYVYVYMNTNTTYFKGKKSLRLKRAIFVYNFWHNNSFRKNDLKYRKAPFLEYSYKSFANPINVWLFNFFYHCPLQYVEPPQLQIFEFINFYQGLRCIYSIKMQSPDRTLPPLPKGQR